MNEDTKLLSICVSSAMGVLLALLLLIFISDWRGENTERMRIEQRVGQYAETTVDTPPAP